MMSVLKGYCIMAWQGITRMSVCYDLFVMFLDLIVLFSMCIAYVFLRQTLTISSTDGLKGGVIL